MSEKKWAKKKFNEWYFFSTIREGSASRIRGAWLRAPLKPLQNSRLCMALRGLRGPLNLAERHKPLEQPMIIIPVCWLDRNFFGEFFFLSQNEKEENMRILHRNSTQREIYYNQTEIRLFLLFSDLLGTKRTSVCFQINRKMVYTIWFRFDLIWFLNNFSVCTNFVQLSANSSALLCFRLYRKTNIRTINMEILGVLIFKIFIFWKSSIELILSLSSLISRKINILIPEK